MNSSIDISDMRLILLNNIYSMWTSKRKFYMLFSSNIRELILFKKYLNYTYKSLYISNDILKLYNTHIDTRIREYYITEKYSKIWLTYHINRKIPVNSLDLELNFIDEKMCINHIDYKERKRYIFTHKDFKKIAETCLMNSYEFDIEPRPMMIKNPYTNNEFTKTELRYFNSNLKDMPVIWHMFTDSDFDILKLKYRYYSYLLDICIPSYVEKLDDRDIEDYIIDICINYNIQYCHKCTSEKNNIKSNKVKNVLISWLRSLKLSKNFSDKYINDIRNVYGEQYCCHKEDDKDDKEDQVNMLYIDMSKPLFCVGYYDKGEEKKRYIKNLKDRKIKERFRKVINKYSV